MNSIPGHPLSVLSALAKSGRQDLIPLLSRELRRQVGKDAWAVHQAVYSLDDLLYLPFGQRRLTRQQIAVFREACAAIGSAIIPTRPYPPSSPETGYVPDPREAALPTLAVLCERFTPRRWRRGLPRWRRDAPGVVGIIAAAVQMPNGDVAVLGPLGASPHDELQAPATIYREGESPLSATYVGRYFDLRGWPPRMGVLLRGIAIGELRVGSRFTADTSEQAEITRGMAEGTLEDAEMFGEVRRGGFGPDEFMILYRRPEDVRILRPEPDPARAWVREKLRETDELLKARPARRSRRSHSAPPGPS